LAEEIEARLSGRAGVVFVDHPARGGDRLRAGHIAERAQKSRSKERRTEN
jgi:hypothetical protein